MQSIILHKLLIVCHTYHFSCRSSSQQGLQIGHNLSHIIVGHVGGEARAYTLAAIDQDHGQDGTVPLWLNLHVVFKLVGEEVIVHCRKEQSGQGAEFGEDVPEGGRVWTWSLSTIFFRHTTSYTHIHVYTHTYIHT